MIQIIGAGAIGCLWLAKFQMADIPCHMVSRREVKQAKLVFTDLHGELHSLSISIGKALLNSNKQEQNSIILVCVKAHQVVEALQQHKAYISEKQIIILMHNGYGCAEQVVKQFPHNPIICATTSNASLVDHFLSITHTGQGTTFLGPFSESAKTCDSTLKLFQQAMPDVHWQNDIKKICWKKLIVNAAINPLSAIHQVKNGQLEEAKFAFIISSLIEEVLQITQAENLLFGFDELHAMIFQVIRATAENYSSMNRDTFYHRKTEIDYINGYLIKRAQQHQLSVPLLIKHFQEIKALESRSLAVEDS